MAEKRKEILEESLVKIEAALQTYQVYLFILLIISFIHILTLKIQIIENTFIPYYIIKIIVDITNELHKCTIL